MTVSIPKLRDKAVHLEPSVRIGKNGITSGILSEIGVLLDKKELVKIKILQGSLEQSQKEELVKEVVEKTGALLVQQVGLTFTLFKAKE
jgi:RNA-binding protein